MKLLVAVVIAVIALAQFDGASAWWSEGDSPSSGRRGSMADDDDECQKKMEMKKWIFAFSRNFPPYSALITDPGELSVIDGLAEDVIREACRVANKKCEFAFIKSFDQCCNAEDEFSPGLNNNWFDGCATAVRTIERDNVLAFSIPFAEERLVNTLYIQTGDNLMLSDLQNANNIKIGFVGGFAINGECLRRNGLFVSDADAITYPNSDALMAALANGEIRVAFNFAGEFPPATFQVFDIGQPIACSLAGAGVMMRKDNCELMDWLNPALQQVIDSPFYQEACTKWQDFFGLDPFCFS